MKELLIFIILLALFSCRTRTIAKDDTNNIQLLIADTTGNKKAKWDLERVEYYSNITKQLGLRDLKKGVDSFEIRAWYNFSFSNSKELYIIKFIDSTFTISYYRYYLKQFDFENKSRDRNWNAITQPIVDSSVCKSVLGKNGDLKKFDLGNIWNLRSQSELQIADSVGFNDCDTYTIEVADKKRYKFLSHHCPRGYYEKLRLKDINNFIGYFDLIKMLAYNNAFIPYKYD